MILDSSALVIAGIDDIRPEQAKLTFAMARHAVVDLTQVLNVRYQLAEVDRLPPEELNILREKLAEKGVRVRNDAQFEQKLAYLRTQYEPYAQAIATRLFITLPPWQHTEKKKDNWQAGPWDRIIQAKGLGRISRRASGGYDHF